MSYTALCVADDDHQAQTICTELRRAGFTDDEFGLITGAARSGSASTTARRTAQFLNDAAPGIGSGGMIGAAIGWMASMGAIAIPGIAPLAAGSLAAALGGAAVGAALAGGGAVLAAFGFTHSDAQRYEDSVRAGKTLVSVHTANGFEIETVLEIFRAAGASHCSWSTTSPVETPAGSETMPTGALSHG